jgi:hypothetical protein
MRFNRDDMIAGAIFLAFGAFFIWGGWDLEIGPSLQMGPGNFPLALSGVLCAIGLLIVASSFTTATSEAQPLHWRGTFFILAAPILFGLSVRGAGFVPAVALSVFSSTCASTKFRVVPALTLTAGITAFCLVIFVFALKVSIPIFGPWIVS